MQGEKLKGILKEKYKFQEGADNYLVRSFYIPCGSKGREYIYADSNSFDQQVAFVRMCVGPEAEVYVELIPRPFVFHFDGSTAGVIVYEKDPKLGDPACGEGKILMEDYGSDYPKTYPLSLKNVKLALSSISKLEEEMSHCFEDVVIS